MPTITTAKVRIRKKKAPVKRRTRPSRDIADSYNSVKQFKGQQYTGMQIGRSHKWQYDAGEWTETKITPDLWELSYEVIKRRVGHAPEGSGVPVGTGYNWFILAHQVVKKINANDYTTKMTGLKVKLSHKRAEKNSWSSSAMAQRKNLVTFLKSLIQELQRKPVPLAFEYDEKKWKGEAVPVPGTCQNGVCYQLDVSLNGEPVGIIHRGKSGWKIKHVEDQKFVDQIGEQIQLWYE